MREVEPLLKESEERRKLLERWVSLAEDLDWPCKTLFEDTYAMEQRATLPPDAREAGQREEMLALLKKIKDATSEVVEYRLPDDLEKELDQYLAKMREGAA